MAERVVTTQGLRQDVDNVCHTGCYPHTARLDRNLHAIRWTDGVLLRHSIVYVTCVWNNVGCSGAVGCDKLDCGSTAASAVQSHAPRSVHRALHASDGHVSPPVSMPHTRWAVVSEVRASVRHVTAFWGCSAVDSWVCGASTAIAGCSGAELLGYVSPTRSTDTPRGLRTCSATKVGVAARLVCVASPSAHACTGVVGDRSWSQSGSCYAVLDGPCAVGDSDAGVLGFVV